MYQKGQQLWLLSQGDYERKLKHGWYELKKMKNMTKPKVSLNNRCPLGPLFTNINIP